MIILRQTQLHTISDELYRLAQQRKRIEHAQEEASHGLMANPKALRDIAFELSSIESELAQAIYNNKGAS
jgi:hypothetical protein